MSQPVEQMLACLASDKELSKGAVLDFNTLFPAKFAAGEKKYTNPLTRKDCVKNAKEEVIDLWAYLTALEEQHRVIKMIIEHEALGSMTSRIALNGIAAVLNYLPNGEIE